MNKIAVALIAIVVVGSGIAFFISGSDENPAAETSSNNQSQSTAKEASDEREDVDVVGEEVVITYADGQFEPATVTVTPGSRVTFVNQSDTDFWPASDDHPIHNDLPSFDSERSLGPGEEYSRIFQEPGEWTYHNHLNSSETGTVNVSGL